MSLRVTTYSCIAQALREAKRPAVLWSGGKDSTTLLHLVRRFRPDVEVIMWKVPWLPEKWEFHERLAREWNLTVFDFPPAWAALCHGNDRIDIMEAYAIGSDALVVARGTEPMTDLPMITDEDGARRRRDWVCGRAWMERPKATAVDFPWDVLFHGHKSVDMDPCSGHIPLELDVLERPGCAKIFYPMRHWTESDVTAYTLLEGIPWDSNRYELITLDAVNDEDQGCMLRTLPDKKLNSDYYSTCLRCIDKRAGKYVRCPLTGLDVENVSGRVQEWVPEMDYCNLRTQPEAEGAR